MAKKSKKKIKPVSIDGLEFDALIEQTKSLSADVPEYPVEGGYSVSDTITLSPMQLQMQLFVTATPVTFQAKHGIHMNRPHKVTSQLEKKYYARKLVKVVTTEAIYTDMAIESISWKRSVDSKYARQIDITLKKVKKTKLKSGGIKSKSKKSGKSKARGGKASSKAASQKQVNKAKKKLRIRKKKKKTKSKKLGG